VMMMMMIMIRVPPKKNKMAATCSFLEVKQADLLGQSVN
jgi:hypothetical protein